MLVLGSFAHAEWTAMQVAENIWNRPEGTFAQRDLVMMLTNPKGKVTERLAQVQRGTWGDVKKTSIVFKEPRRIKNTAFLIHDDVTDSKNDQQWMFLPALGRERRIPASDKGDNFMGSEFSYEDIKSDLKFSLSDYQFINVENRQSATVLIGVPANSTLQKELGYSRFEAEIDTSIWMPKSIVFWDIKDRLLKTVSVMDVQVVEGFTVATRVHVENHQSGHQSEFAYRNIQFPDSIRENEFDVSSLRR